VDAGFDENEAELGVLVLAVALEVLADGDGLNITVSELLMSFVSGWVEVKCVPS
jgi:hypothetical protein